MTHVEDGETLSLYLKSLSSRLLDDLGELAKMSRANLKQCTLQLRSSPYWHYVCWHVRQQQRSSTSVCSGIASTCYPSCGCVSSAPASQFFSTGASDLNLSCM